MAAVNRRPKTVLYDQWSNATVFQLLLSTKGLVGRLIHYRGKLDNTDDLPGLCEKLIFIATGLEWEYQTLKDVWSVPANAVLEHRGEWRGNQGESVPRPFYRHTP